MSKHNLCDFDDSVDCEIAFESENNLCKLVKMLILFMFYKHKHGTLRCTKCDKVFYEFFLPSLHRVSALDSLDRPITQRRISAMPFFVGNTMQCNSFRLKSWCYLLVFISFDFFLQSFFSYENKESTKEFFFVCILNAQSDRNFASR